MTMSTNTSFNNLFSNEDIFNQQKRSQLSQVAHPSPPPPSFDVTPPLPESFLEPKSKSPKAILQALTDIDGSTEQGKQTLITLQYTIERVIKDKEAEVSDDIKKAPWSALNTIHKDLKDSITSEVVKKVKKIIQYLLRKRWNKVGASQRRHEGNESNKRCRIKFDYISD
ncbi:hypothetical protein BDC45DRAFT_582205 [Circinella umbellata]|nr:hypothetical protein BDC45DRAFT_582205 [Circinella umbellata]